MRIKMLNEETINKIAAGEVIIRPVSVIKELVENAIDAGSTRISVSILQGGTQSMTVTDNGCGIPYNEVQLAFERHATSKLLEIEDLQQIRTLGFRGEALSSIMAVSRVKITTRDIGEEIGSQTVFEGGKCINQRVCGHDRGTTITVSDLFYNVPARRKHMSKAKTEGAIIRDMMEKLALSHPEIAFSLTGDGKKQFSTVGSGKLRDAVEGVFGRSFFNGLIPLNAENTPMRLTGYIGNLTASRSTRDLQIFYINGRYVKNPELSKAFEEAYEGYLMKHRYPVGIVFIELPGRMLDVNVHPAKTEIAILNHSLFYILFKQGIRQALRHADLAVSVGIQKDEKQDSLSFSAERSKEESVQKQKKEEGEQMVQMPFVLESSKNTEILKSEPMINSITKSSEDLITDKIDQYDAKSKDIVLQDMVCEKTENLQNTYPEKTTAEKKPIPEPKMLPKIDFSGAKIVGQLFATYLLLEQQNEMILIDQHAAHEAFMYEALRQQFDSRERFPTQTLLVPVPVAVERRMIKDFEEHAQALSDLGFDCDVFGEETLLVRSVPVILGEPQPAELINVYLDDLFYETHPDRDIQIQKIITMSCKSAVKGNQRLSDEEIRTLLDKLMLLENPFTCPHGRPIIFKLKRYELEKLFKRVI